MSIRFACPGCSAAIKVADHLGGHKATCPKCQALCKVPVPEAKLLPEPTSPLIVEELPRTVKRRALDRSPIGGAMAGLLGMAFVGLAASQYFPVFGGLLERR